MSRLAQINKKYEDIMSSNMTDHQKGVKLGELMTKMEREFRIPLLQDHEWEKKNKAVIALYRKISVSRKF